MTIILLQAVAHARSALAVKAIYGLLVLSLLPITLIIDVVRFGFRRILNLRVLSTQQGSCPKGHAVDLYGLWQCSCGLSYEGHAFTHCPHCLMTAHGVNCPCGQVVVNPLTPLSP